MSTEKKKMTLEDLAQEMQKGFTAVDNKIKESEKKIIKYIDTKIDRKIDELAMITQHGFDSLAEQFKKVDEQFNEVSEKLDDLDRSNNQAHENTSLRLNEVAYKFEMVDLKKRVEVLEKKAKVHA